jgi:aspartate/methionine/tyrosine aminotransferase
VLADEIYQGAELDGVETPSVWGRYDRIVITNGLSKAYGLPGLRIGWIASSPALIASLWSYHDYTTIAPGALSDRLGRHALAPDNRRRILARTRGILNANYPIIDTWLRQRGDQFSHIDPEAGAIVYIRYDRPINSLRLVTELRQQKSVLIVPGDHFLMDGHLRIGFGTPGPHLREGLRRLHELLNEIEVVPAR